MSQTPIAARLCCMEAAWGGPLKAAKGHVMTHQARLPYFKLAPKAFKGMLDLSAAEVIARNRT